MTLGGATLAVFVEYARRQQHAASMCACAFGAERELSPKMSCVKSSRSTVLLEASAVQLQCYGGVQKDCKNLEAHSRVVAASALHVDSWASMPRWKRVSLWLARGFVFAFRAVYRLPSALPRATLPVLCGFVCVAGSFVIFVATMSGSLNVSPA